MAPGVSQEEHCLMAHCLKATWCPEMFLWVVEREGAGQEVEGPLHSGQVMAAWGHPPVQKQRLPFGPFLQQSTLLLLLQHVVEEREEAEPHGHW